MEQLVARWAHNPKVVGSSPAPATKFYFKSCFVYVCFYVFINMLIFYVIFLIKYFKFSLY